MISDISSTVIQLLWKISWQATALSVIVLVVSWFLGKAPASFRYTLWLIVLCKFFVPPIAKFPAALAFWLKAPTPNLAAEYGPYFGVVANTTAQSSSVENAQASLTAFSIGWVEVISFLWFVGVLTMLTLAVVRNIRLHRLLREVSDPGDEIAAEWAECADSIGLRRIPKILLSHRIHTPMLVGIVRPTVFLPKHIMRYCTRTDLRAMLLHELSHIKRKDMFGVWLSQLAQILFFFHPMMWYTCRAIRSERELACDQFALARSAISPREYAAGYIAALKLITNSCKPLPSLAMAEPFGLEKRRLEQILRNPSPKFSITMAIALVALVAAGLPSYSGCATPGSRAVSTESGQIITPDDGTVFSYAAAGDLPRLRAKIDSHPEQIHARDDSEATPLHIAARYGHKSVAEFLIDRGSSVNAIAGDGSTPLAQAASRGFKDVAALLIAKGAWVDAGDGAGATPLMSAAQNGHKAVVELLLDNEAYIDALDAHDPGNSPLSLAVRHGHTMIVELLISRGANVDVRNRWHRTPLMSAAYAGNLDAVKTLIAAGAKVNAKDKWEHTPLSDAVLMDKQPVARYLISRGADVNMTSEGISPLFLAAHYGRTAMTAILLENKAKVDARSNGVTPLFEAVAYDHIDVVNLLLKAGADVNAGADGKTPVAMALENENEEIVRILRAFGGKE